MSKKQIPDESNPFSTLDKSRFAKERPAGGGHRQKQSQAEVKALLKAAAKAKAEQSDEEDNYFAAVMSFGGVSRLQESPKIVRKSQPAEPQLERQGQAGLPEKPEKEALKEALPGAGLSEAGLATYAEADDFAAAFAESPATPLAGEEAAPGYAVATLLDGPALKAPRELKKQNPNAAKEHKGNQNKRAEAFDSPLQGLLAGVKIDSATAGRDLKNFDSNLRGAERQQSSPGLPASSGGYDKLGPAKGGQVSLKQASQANGLATRQQGDLGLPAASLPEDDEFLFVEAMNAVAPLKSSGRAIAPPPLASGAVIAPSNPLQDFMDGKVEFSLAHTDEYVEGHVLGLDPAVVVKMRAGSYSFEAHLDLHGLNAAQAFDALVAFIRSSYQRGLRNVLVIPGRGKNSPDGFGLLRDKVQEWFMQDPFKRVVLAFCTALPKHGGPGALYVLLRKFKKSRGKVFWDKRPSDPDLFI